MLRRPISYYYFHVSLLSMAKWWPPDVSASGVEEESDVYVSYVRACVCVCAQESEERAASFPDPLIGIGSTLKEGHWRIRRLVVWLVVRCKGPAEKWRGGSLSDAVISQRPSSFNRDSIVPPCLIYSIERNDQFPFITFYFHRYIYIYMYNRE